VANLRDPIVVIGSGASGVHFAETALSLGRRVVMLDVGHPSAAPVLPEASLNQLKAELEDPVAYFLGEQYESMILPGDDSEYYGFPPSKSYVFKGVPQADIVSKGFAPLQSFARGGLAQAWTGGSYPFSDGELEAFPFGWDDIAPHYEEVAQRIGISGATDDLSQFLPMHTLQEPLTIDAHSSRLLTDYEKKRATFNGKHGFYMGRARIAALSKEHAGRGACTYLGRCLWGCPRRALYTPSFTLEQLKLNPAFEYVPDLNVVRFVYDDANRVTKVVSRRVTTGADVEHAVGTLVLAAGTLSSARILLASLHAQGVRQELRGLMDNRQVLMPFVNLGRIGKRFEERSYQYNQVAVGVPGDKPIDYVHGLVTTLTTALVHPVVQSLPVGARTAMALFRNLHSALGLLNINFPDYRRDDNQVALEIDARGRPGPLLVSYSPPASEPELIARTNKRFRSFLMGLGCIAPPNMTRPRPMGASVHYAGTLPMVSNGGELTTDLDGRCRPFENLLCADGSTFPSLPAKNLTFTLMANATRLARLALQA
jgi:choline dehydrogenase-like flavoprotein